mgnify:CR=1 FL=1
MISGDPLEGATAQCPACLVEMAVEGEVVGELAEGDELEVIAARWVCPSCGLIKL